MGFDNESWNVRDRHMMETLDRLLKFHGREAKAIVWAHNTHIGDARATNMSRNGMINIGQLAREQYGINEIYLSGFGTYSGSVIAGEEWGAPMQELEMPLAREGSIEHLLHQESTEDRYLLFNTEDLRRRYDTEIRHRAIGVVYFPQFERQGNYVPSVLSQRYDAFIFLDETTALHPIHLKPHDEKMAETYPFGF
jgi:erythromycin esterase-like protein